VANQHKPRRVCFHPMLSVWILAPNTTSAQCVSDSLDFCATYCYGLKRPSNSHVFSKASWNGLISWVSRDNKRIGSNEHEFHSRQSKFWRRKEKKKGIKSGAVQAGLVAGQGSNIKVRGKRQTKSRRCKTECPWVEHGGPSFWWRVGTWHYFLFLPSSSLVLHRAIIPTRFQPIHSSSQ
jgi:hypothetical protein